MAAALYLVERNGQMAAGCGCVGDGVDQEADGIQRIAIEVGVGGELLGTLGFEKVASSEYANSLEACPVFLTRTVVV